MRRGPLALAGLVASITGFGGLTLTASAEAADHRPDAATAFRVAFGLRSDAEYIQQVADQEHAMDWGVPLTAAEAADINERARIAQEKGPLHEAIDADPNFGGLYTDQEHEGVIVVRLTEISASSLQAIKGSVPDGAAFRVDAADYTWKQLTAKMSEISASRTNLVEHGLPVTSLLVDPVTNRVRLGIDPFTVAVAEALVD